MPFNSNGNQSVDSIMGGGCASEVKQNNNILLFQFITEFNLILCKRITIHKTTKRELEIDEGNRRCVATNNQQHYNQTHVRMYKGALPQ